MTLDAQSRGARKSSKASTLDAGKKPMSMSLPSLDWSDIKEARKTVGLNPWPSSKTEGLEDILGTLTSQKGVTAPAGPSQTLLDREKILRASMPSRPASEPDLRVQKPSTIHGSANYSFGPGYKKNRHLKGRMKIPVLEPRDPEKVPGSGDVLGPGQYENRHYLGDEVVQAGGGITGGWKACSHNVFVRVFNDFHQKATPEFFDRVAVLLPEISRLDIVNHVKWFANYEEHKMKLDHMTLKFREEKLVAQELASQPERRAISKEMSGFLESSRRQRFADTQRIKSQLAELHEQADNERERWGLKEEMPPLDGFKSVQVNALDKAVVDGVLRGHPEFKRAPGYTFSCSGELRDTKEKRFTKNSHVRSSSHLDNPGPGAYIGLDEPDKIMRRSATCVFAKDMRFYNPGLAIPDLQAAQAQADMETRLKRVGARKGELTISLMWDTAAVLELRVVPPGGQRGLEEISQETPKLAGGRLDTAINVPIRGNTAGRPQPVQSVSWPPYYLGSPQSLPPMGPYEIYLVVCSKNDAFDTPWLCRILVGNSTRWAGGCVRGGQEMQHIFSFKYDGPVDSSTKIQEEIRATQFSKPGCIFSKTTEHQHAERCATEGHVLTDLVSSPHAVGPGLYMHSTSNLTQY